MSVPLFYFQIVLNSMHRYQPRIHLVRCRQTDDNNLHITDLQKEEHKTFIFPEAIFTAVTAYQNQLVSTHGARTFLDRFESSTNFANALPIARLGLIDRPDNVADNEAEDRQ